MKIGMIGAGNIGSTVGELWAKAGHELFFGTRHPEALASLIQRLGPSTQAGTIEEAAAFGPIVFCSAPYGAWPELAVQIAPLTVGKIVIDAANPYPERDGDFAKNVLATDEGSAVPIQQLLPETHLVRAFNSVYYLTLGSEAHREGELLGIPLASDDNKALEVVARLVRDAGFGPVNVGGLARAKDFDVGSAAYNNPMNAAALSAALLGK